MRSPIGDGERCLFPSLTVDRLAFGGENGGPLFLVLTAVLGGGLGALGEVLSFWGLAKVELLKDNLRRNPVPLSI
jgi:hypothetical protein